MMLKQPFFHTARPCSSQRGGSRRRCLGVQADLQVSRLLLGLVLLSSPSLALNVTNRMLTKAVDTSGCTVPTPATAFLTTDKSVWLWFSVTGANFGDVPSVTWYSPGGIAYKSGSWNPAPSAGSRCYWWYIDVAGNPPASSPGAWSVQVAWNGSPLFTLPFSIVAPPAPSINAGGITNLASLSQGPFAAGSQLAIRGASLASATTYVTSAPLPTNLNGAQVRIGGFAAPLLYVSPARIELQVPWELAGQAQAAVTVQVNGTAGAPQTVSLAPYDPGIYAMDGSGAGQGEVVIANTGVLAAPAGALPGLSSRPVQPGEAISVFATGLGAVTNRPASGAAALTNPLSWTTVMPAVILGGVPTPVTFSGLDTEINEPGLYRVDALVPANAPAGDAVPLSLSIGNVVSNTVTIAVAGAALRITPATATIPAGRTQQFTATVSGATNPAATWSVNDITGGNPDLGIISATGLYTAPEAVPSPNTVTVKASANGVTGTATVTITAAASGMLITSLSNSSPIPLTPLQIYTTGLDPAVPVQIRYSDSLGYSVTQQPIRVAADGSVTAGVPLYISPATGQIGPGATSLVLTQGSQSTEPITLNIRDLPPLSAYGTQPGQISHAFLVFEALLHSWRLNDLQSAQLVLGSAIDTSDAQKTVTSLLRAAILARKDVDTVMSNRSAVIGWGTLPGGTAIQFDRSQLDVMDRIIAIYLTQQFGSIGTPAPNSLLQAPMVKEASLSTSALSGSQFLAGLENTSSARALAANASSQENPTHPGMGFWTGLFSVLMTPFSERFAAAVGMVSGLLHVQEAVDSLMQSVGLAADCCGSSSCTPAQAQAIENAATSAAFSAAVAQFSMVAHIGALAGLPQAESALSRVASTSAEAAALLAGLGSSGALQNALDVTRGIASEPALSQVIPRLGSVTGATPPLGLAPGSPGYGLVPPQSGVKLCGFGPGGLCLPGLADTSNKYVMNVPMEIPGTDYPHVSASATDPLSGTVYGSEVVDLRGLNANAPVQVPPIPAAAGGGGGANLTGTWKGTWTRSVTGLCNSETSLLTWNLTQDGTKVTGTFSDVITATDGFLCPDAVGTKSSGKLEKGEVKGQALTIFTEGGVRFDATFTATTISCDTVGALGKGHFTLTKQ
jgi:uncharacterized protein (TIGR03437 family)